jgi:hypothetical protein
LPAQSADPDQYADQEAAILGWNDSFGKIANYLLINLSCSITRFFELFVF